MQVHTTRKPQHSPIIHGGVNHVPARMIEIELGRPLSTISAIDEQASLTYARAVCLVRLHSQPLGIIELQLDKGGLSPCDYAQRIWCSFAEKINEHLQQDGLPLVTELDTAGLGCFDSPRCIKERDTFFAHAPFVSIIVSTRDRPKQLERCLRSLLSLQYPHYEVIVVDNASSTDATANIIEQSYPDIPWLRYIREDRPGASWARNTGILAAGGEILAFTDDDVVVDAYWLLELVRAFDLAGDVACVTGLVLPLELETPPQVWFEEYGGFSKGFISRIFDMAEYHPKTPLHPYTAGQFGSGVNVAFSAAFLHTIGGYDPALGPGTPACAGEDLALFFQAIIRGHKLVYAPAALLYHLHRRDYASLYQQMYDYGVGLTAYLAKSLLDSPRLLFDLLARLPYGLYFTLSTRSPKNRKKSIHYPKELTRLELKGMLYGPLAYVRGRYVVWFARQALRKRGKQVPPPLNKVRTMPRVEEEI